MFNSSQQRTKINTLTLDSIFSFYQPRQPQEICDYLELHPDLLSILQEGKALIIPNFSSENVFLELATDPEIADNQLVVYLKRHEEDVETALSLIEQLYDEWLGKYKGEIRSQIYLRYDYQ